MLSAWHKFTTHKLLKTFLKSLDASDADKRNWEHNIPAYIKHVNELHKKVFQITSIKTLLKALEKKSILWSFHKDFICLWCIGPQLFYWRVILNIILHSSVSVLEFQKVHIVSLYLDMYQRVLLAIVLNFLYEKSKSFIISFNDSV